MQLEPSYIQNKKNTFNSLNPEDKNDVQMMKTIDDYDEKMLKYIIKLNNSLHKDKIDLDSVQDSVSALQMFNQREQFSYLENLLKPEYCKGVKIPNPIPLPSTSFQLHNSITLSTNTSGNFCLVMNPFFLYNSQNLKQFDVVMTETYKYIPTWLTSCYFNNSDTLDGRTITEMRSDGSYADWKPVNLGQSVPGVYSQYRVVSASIVMKYIGRLDQASGVIGGGIVFDQRKQFGGYISSESGQLLKVIPDGLSKYDNFDIAMDSFYNQENLSIQGIRELYFPLDNSFEEFVKTMDSDQFTAFNGSGSSATFTPKFGTNESSWKEGFNYMIYALGAPPSSSCFKMDIYVNYETLPSPEFLNYMPISPPVPVITSAEKHYAVTTVQKKPIMRADETDSIVSVQPKLSLWERFKSKFGGFIPGIGKMILGGLANTIPGLKPGLDIAKSLMKINTGINTNIDYVD